MQKQAIRFVAIILAVVLLTAVAGCGESHNASPLPSENLGTSGPEMAVKGFIQSIVTQRTDDWIAGLLAKGVNEELKKSVDTEISDVKTEVISQGEDDAVVEVRYHVDVHIGSQNIQPDMPGVEVNIKPQTLKWDLYQSMELVKSGDVWEVANYFSGPASEKLQTEFTSIQAAIGAILEQAQVTELDAAYYGVDTESEAKSVTAKNGIYGLFLYYQPYKYPYAQAYDITKSGTVTVHQP